MQCTGIELGIGAIALVLIVSFWLGMCFITGMRMLGEQLGYAITKLR